MRNPPCAWYKYNIRTDCLLAAPFRATSSMRPTAGILEADNKPATHCSAYHHLWSCYQLYGVQPPRTPVFSSG